LGASWVQTSAPQTNWVAVATSANGNKLVAAVRNGGIYTWQAPPAPQLNIVLTQGQVVLSWAAPSSSILQQNTDLSSANWAALAAAPALTNGEYQVILQPQTTGASFYRLKNP